MLMSLSLSLSVSVSLAVPPSLLAGPASFGTLLEPSTKVFAGPFRICG
ncbi:hypothetical protein [Frankia sp. R43]|nr:hypothetical protein [Frankia sp. R43]